MSGSKTVCGFSIILILTQLRMGLFRTAHGWGREKRSPVPKICYTYSTMMKLRRVIPYLKKTQKSYESRDTPLEFCQHQHFFIGNQQILLYQKIQIQIAFLHIIYNLLTFFEFLKIFFVSMVKSLIMSAKLAASGLLKIIFQNKGYDVLIVDCNVTNKVLSRDSNHIVDVRM